MRSARVCFAACLLVGCTLFQTPAWEQPPPETRDLPVVQPGALHRTELPNGLRIYVLEDHRLPRLALSLDVRRGEASVDPAEAGLAPFAAELMKRGAGKRDALALAGAVDEIGASLGVGADWDSTGVEVSGLSRDFDALFEILADVVLRPRFDPEEARNARSQSLAALERAKDDPATLTGWYTARALYPGHRFGLPHSGTQETVARLDAAAARAFHARVFVPNDAILSAVGDVDAEAVFERARAFFGSWPRGPETDPGPPPPDPAPAERRIVIVDRPDLAQARIQLAHEGISRTYPDRIAAGLMNAVVGGDGFSSRLTETLRADAGLTYGVNSSFSMRRRPGPFVVATFTRVPEVRRALDLLIEVLERARSEPPSEKELRDAQTLAVGRFALGLESSAAVLGAIVDLDIYGLPEDSLDTYRARVRAVAVDDTARMARELLHPERAAIVLTGPAEQLRPQVEDLGPVEVVLP